MKNANKALEREWAKSLYTSWEHPGTPYLHKDKFTRGKGLFQSVEFILPNELPNKEYPFLLSTGRELYHYNSGTMTRGSIPFWGNGG